MSKPVPLGEIFRSYERETNPCTKSAYRVILVNRLNALESMENRLNALERGQKEKRNEQP